ncbi:hypothetical protein V8E52_008077 [Russula decolorans]
MFLYVSLFSFSLSLSRVHSHPIFFAQYLRLRNCCPQCPLAWSCSPLDPRSTLAFTDLLSALCQACLLIPVLTLYFLSPLRLLIDQRPGPGGRLLGPRGALCYHVEKVSVL